MGRREKGKREGGKEIMESRKRMRDRKEWRGRIERRYQKEWGGGG